MYARDVVDYIEYMDHLSWVMSMCDSAITAHSIFNCFQGDNMSSARRGKLVVARDHPPTNRTSWPGGQTPWYQVWNEIVIGQVTDPPTLDTINAAWDCGATSNLSG